MSKVAAAEAEVSGTRVQVVDGWEFLVNGEPRVRDIDLAERAGMPQPRNVRSIIRKRRPTLEAYGSIAERTRCVRSGNLEGSGPQEREVTEFWLNEGQAHHLAFYMRTPKALELQVAIVKVFIAFRRGQLGAPPAPEPDPQDLLQPYDRITATEAKRRGKLSRDKAMAKLGQAIDAAEVAAREVVSSETGLAWAALVRLLSDSANLLCEGTSHMHLAIYAFKNSAGEVSRAVDVIREGRERGKPTEEAALVRAGAAVELAK